MTNDKSRERQNLRFLLSIDVNLQRNHFTSSQLAVVALDIEKIFAVEAEKVKLQNLKQFDTEGTKLSLRTDSGRSAAKAAIMLKTSATYVKDAKKLEKDAPDLLEKVRIGEINLSQAKQELKKRELRGF